MTVSLSAHFDGKSIILDEKYPLRPQASLLVTVLEDKDADDSQAERRTWSVCSAAMNRSIPQTTPFREAIAAFLPTI